MQIIKIPGSSFGARLLYQHIGPAQSIWIGIGLSYGLPSGHNPPFCHAMAQVDVPANLDWNAYYIDVTGTIPLDALDGEMIDAQRFISITQPVIGQQPPNDFGLNDWDDEVYAIEQVKFQGLVVDPEVGYF